MFLRFLIIVLILFFEVSCAGIQYPKFNRADTVFEKQGNFLISNLFSHSMDIYHNDSDDALDPKYNLQTSAYMWDVREYLVRNVSSTSYTIDTSLIRMRFDRPDKKKMETVPLCRIFQNNQKIYKLPGNGAMRLKCILTYSQETHLVYVHSDAKGNLVVPLKSKGKVFELKFPFRKTFLGPPPPIAYKKNDG